MNFRNVCVAHCNKKWFFIENVKGEDVKSWVKLVCINS